MKVTITGTHLVKFTKVEEIHSDDLATVKEIIQDSDGYELLDYLGGVEERDYEIPGRVVEVESYQLSE